MKKESGNVLFGFLLLVVSLIAVFVGLPYLIQLVKQSAKNIPVYQTPAGSGGYSKTVQQSNTTAENPKPQILPGESIFKRRVSISGVYTYNRQQINLTASQNSGGALNITGWKIISSRGYETMIGRANPLIGFGIAGDIWLVPGGQVQIYAGQSNIIDSFQVNKCLGWLGNIYTFDPSLSNYCPQFSLSDLQGLDGYCQNLILNSSSCQQPSADVLNNGASSACRAFVDQNLNYNSCVNRHRSDKDFFGEWRVYTGSDILVADPIHDLLKLKDSSGLTVDQYQY